MKDIIVFALLGLGSGALIAGLALAVVLDYRGSGTVNLAMGAYAMVGAYAYSGLRTEGTLFLPPIPLLGAKPPVGGLWPAFPSFVVALLVCMATAAFFELAVGRRLRLASPLAKLVASLGLLLTLQAIVVLRFGTQTQPAPAVMPTDTVSILGTPIPVNRFILAGLAVLFAGGLALLYRRTRFGIQTRAAQENVESAMLSGLSPQLLALWNSMLAAALAAALGILVAPITQLNPQVLALAVIPALAAALIANFTSFWTAMWAGLGMGIATSLIVLLQSKSWFPSVGGDNMPGLDSLFFFVVIATILFFRSDAVPTRGSLLEQRLPPVPRPPRQMALVIGAVVIAVLIIVFPIDYRQAMITSMIGALMCLSFVVLTGYVGQMSLLQAAIAGVSALAITRLSTNAGIAFPIAPILGIAAATLIGLVAGISALRVRGVNLAIVTMAAAIALESFWFANTSFGINETNSTVPEPKLFGVDFGPHSTLLGSAQPSPVFGLVCLLVVLAVCLGIGILRERPLGLQMLAVRSNERAAVGAGLDATQIKLRAYVISAVIAGIAGTLYAYNFGSVTSERFSLSIVLMLVAFAYLGGITSIGGALIGGFLVTDGVMTHVLTDAFGLPAKYQLIFGGLALMVTIAQAPEGLTGLLSKQRERMTRGRFSPARVTPKAAVPQRDAK